MKRFVFWFVAALVAISVLRQHRRHDEPDREPTHRRTVVVHRHSAPGLAQTTYYIEGDKRNRTSLASLKDRYGDRIVFAFGDDEEDDQDDARDGTRRVQAEGLPVPIVPGSRVTEARPEPPKPPRAPKAVKAPKKAKRAEPPKPPVAPTPPTPPPASVPTELIKVTGRLSATEDRARKDAVAKLDQLIGDRLNPEVPRSWKVPASLTQKMIVETKIVPHDRDYGTVYDATLVVDVSPNRQAEIINTYRHEKVVKRLAVLGGGLLFVLSCLGAVSGYIRADEATKGYYTNALRLAAAAGVGAAGTVLYHTLA